MGSPGPKGEKVHLVHFMCNNELLFFPSFFATLSVPNQALRYTGSIKPNGSRWLDKTSVPGAACTDQLCFDTPHLGRHIVNISGFFVLNWFHSHREVVAAAQYNHSHDDLKEAVHKGSRFSRAQLPNQVTSGTRVSHKTSNATVWIFLCRASKETMGK